MPARPRADELQRQDAVRNALVHPMGEEPLGQNEAPEKQEDERVGHLGK